MKLTKLKDFEEVPGQTLTSVIQFLKEDLSYNFRELNNLVSSLRFEDNFTQFIVSVTIPPSSEIPIRNQMRGVLPTKWIVLRTNQYGLSVCDGDTAWNQDYVYLKNTTGAGTATMTVMFLP